MTAKAFWLAAFLASIPAAAFSQDVRAPQSITIVSPRQAVEAALAYSPALRGAGAARQAVQSDALQARVRPNPAVNSTFENFGGIGGRGDYRSGRAVETTIGIAQRIELGGKRSARIDLAGRSGELADADFAGARLDLAREVVSALAAAEAASRLAGVERERARLAGETLRAARARVEAGRDPPLQAERAEVVRATAEISAERAQREVEIALGDLAVFIGVPRVALAPRQPWFDDLGSASPATLPADPMARLSGNPDLARLTAAIAQQRASVTLQRANAVPDLTVSGDVRRFGDTGETAFVAGASMPLPFYDRNQGGIARAQAELLRAEAEADRGRSVLTAALIAAEQRMTTAWRTAQTLRRTALPAAETAARYASGGFTEGKFSFLEVLDAQRALSDARAQFVDALREFHTRRAAVERLRGQLPSGPNGSAR